MPESLSGQVAIITGGSRGIGLTIAQAFAAEGTVVALVARSEAAVRPASETIRFTEPRTPRPCVGCVCTI